MVTIWNWAGRSCSPDPANGTTATRSPARPPTVSATSCSSTSSPPVPPTSSAPPIGPPCSTRQNWRRERDLRVALTLDDMARLVRHIRTVLRALDGREFTVLVPLAVGMRLLQLCLRVGGSRRTLRLLRCIPVAGSRRTASVADALAFARIVRLAGEHGPFQPLCLSRALTVWAWMRWRGLPGTVQIGVSVPTREADAFSAHAWAECDGEPITQGHEGLAVFGRPFVSV